MIRKPPGNWSRHDEGAAVRTVRTAAAVATGGVSVVRRSGQALVGLICFFFAALWGFAALASGLTMGLPSFIGIGAMAAGMFWLGRRAFAKARETS
jgi:hypothetical protein